MSGTLINNVWQTLQNIGTALTSISATVKSGVAINLTPTSYLVAALPATAASGQPAWASNGRKPGEPAAGGTGVPVFFNPITSTWFSYLSGAQVTS